MLTFAGIQIEDSIEDKTSDILSGYILTKENGWTEGLAKDMQGNKKFIFGTFNRLKNFQLYSLDPDNPKELYKFDATKSPIYPFYAGKTSLVNSSNKQYVATCKITSILLEKDPRDSDNDEKEHFLNNLENWKISILNGEAKQIYEEYFSRQEGLTNDTPSPNDSGIR